MPPTTASSSGSATESYIPIKGEFYSASGKMLRSAEYLDVKDFGGIKRPSRIVMKNRLDVKKLQHDDLRVNRRQVQPSAQRFTLDDLGH